jgi:hypothetical protein
MPLPIFATLNLANFPVALMLNVESAIAAFLYFAQLPAEILINDHLFDSTLITPRPASRWLL